MMQYENSCCTKHELKISQSLSHLQNITSSSSNTSSLFDAANSENSCTNHELKPIQSSNHLQNTTSSSSNTSSLSDAANSSHQGNGYLDLSYINGHQSHP